MTPEPRPTELQELRELTLGLQNLLFKTIRKMQSLERKLKYAGASGGVSDHALLSNVLANQHHTPTSLFTALTDTIADAQTPNTLLLDGSRAMTGDLDMNGNDILLSSQVLLTTSGVEFRVMNPAKTSFLSIRSDNGFFTTIASTTATMNIRTGTGNTDVHRFQSRDVPGSAWITVLESGGSDNRCDIPRAGDITMLANKILSGLGDVRAPSLPTTDPADGNSKLWKDANGFVKVGT